jgi:hypothetical protein
MESLGFPGGSILKLETQKLVSFKKTPQRNA